MNVNIKEKDKELTITINGRIDTTTAPELESQMPNLEDINKIIFDFENVEYISSSGLRLILKTKKNVDDTSVINCNKEVYNIFDVTGFDEMMTIKKALRKISIDNCELIGEGFYGKIYRLDPETIVKVYKISEALDMVTRETQIAKKAFIMGIPTAIPYDIVKVDDQYGAVFELLNAEPVANLVDNDEALDKFAIECAKILKNMHQKEGDFPSRKDTVKEYLHKCENLFDKKVYNKLISLLNTIPDSNHIVHSDFHLKNIMLQKDELLLIDMETLSTGNPIFEFGSMYATYIAFSCVDKQNTDKFIGMPLEITTKLFNKIFRYYYDDKTEEELKIMEEKISIIAYIQVLYLRSKFADLAYGTEKEEVEFCQKYLTEEANKLDTLSLEEGVK